MKKTWAVQAMVGVVGAAFCFVTAWAKLPAPSDEAKAAAAAAAEKGAWGGKVAGYQLCKAQDKAVAHYRSTGKDVKPATPTAACVDPGPFVAAAKPVEAAAAPSPAAPAISAPAAKQPDAAANPVKKP